MKKSNKRDGRGRSPGSRATQFSKSNQPRRYSRRRNRCQPEAAELLHKTIYEPVFANLGGKRVKIPFIDAFLRSMRNNAISAKIDGQIKYFSVLIDLDVFSFEEYKESLFRRINGHFKKMAASYGEMADLLEEIGAAYRQAQLLYIFYFAAYFLSRERCTCGACESAIDDAERLASSLLTAALMPDELDDDADADDVDEADDEEPSGINEKPDEDDDFHRGLGWD